MERLKKYFQPKPHEIQIYRVWMAIVAFFLPVYGLFLMHFDPAAIEFLRHRVIISSIWVAMLIASYFSKGFKKYLPIPVFFANIITIGWIMWIVHINNFSFEYVIGLIVSMACIGLFLRDKYELFVFELFLIVMGIVTLTLDNVEVNIPIFLMSIIIIFVVFTLEMFRRDSIYNKMSKLNMELSQRNNELEQFVYVVSHDLKTPLRTIGSFASLLKGKINSDEGEIKEYADFIVNGALDMNAVIDDLLDYSRYADRELKTTEFDLTKLISEVGTVCKLAYPDSEVNLKLEDDIPQIISGNQNQIKRLFQNLIDNGIKYNRSKSKEISIDYQSDQKFHIFKVRDNGIGLPMEYKHKAFQLFQRLHVGEEFTGTGLGLAICKRIVENHLGEIKVISAGNNGTEFRFTLNRRL